LLRQPAKQNFRCKGACLLVKTHLLMLASWQNGISPSNFLRNANFHVISTTK